MFQNHFLIFGTLQVLLESKKSKPNVAFRDWPFQNPVRVACHPPPASLARPRGASIAPPHHPPGPSRVCPRRSSIASSRPSRRVRCCPLPSLFVARRPPRRAVPTTCFFALERRSDETVGGRRCVRVDGAAERASRLVVIVIAIVVSRRADVRASFESGCRLEVGTKKRIGGDCAASCVTL